MCRLVIGTPCPDCVATMTALKLDLGVITHNDFFAGGAWMKDGCRSGRPFESEAGRRGMVSLPERRLRLEAMTGGKDRCRCC